jgi:hypothetical protein
VKIGIAVDPDRRLSVLQEGSPEILELVATRPGTVVDERRLHERFAEARAHGEWFDATPEILLWLDTLNDGADLMDES